MYNKLILYLFRKKFGLKKNQHFRFANQASKTDSYYFTSSKSMKQTKNIAIESNVKLNWLLDDNCEIVKLNM